VFTGEAGPPPTLAEVLLGILRGKEQTKRGQF